MIIPVVITVYGDRSYTFITKTPPARGPAAEGRRLAKGSGEPNGQGRQGDQGAGRRDRQDQDAGPQRGVASRRR